MLEQIRTVIQVASSVAEVPRRQAEKFARDLAKRGDLRDSQISKVAEEIMKRSRENAQMVQSLVGSEIKRQIKALGLVTRDELERLNRRVFGLATKEDVERLKRRLDDYDSKKVATKPKSAPKKAST